MPPTPSPLLTVRTAVVLLLALVVGLLAGGLAYLADYSLPAAVLVAGGAAGGRAPAVPQADRPVSGLARMAAGKAVAVSGGFQPGTEISPSAVAAMGEAV